MEKLVKSSQAYKKCNDSMNELWAEVGYRMYSLDKKNKQLGLGESGVTTYFSANCTLEDSKIANQFLTAKVRVATASSHPREHPL